MGAKTRMEMIISSLGMAALCALCLVFSAPCFAQNRVDLDDLNIKGDLKNDDRLRLTARERHKLVDRVTYRYGFRKEITDRLEVEWPEAISRERDDQ